MKTGSSHAAAEAAASTSTSGGGASAKTAAAAAYASISGRGADAKTAAVGAIARSNDERCLRRRIQIRHKARDTKIHVTLDALNSTLASLTSPLRLPFSVGLEARSKGKRLSFSSVSPPPWRCKSADTRCHSVATSNPPNPRRWGRGIRSLRGGRNKYVQKCEGGLNEDM